MSIGIRMHHLMVLNDIWVIMFHWPYALVLLGIVRFGPLTHSHLFFVFIDLIIHLIHNNHYKFNIFALPFQIPYLIYQTPSIFQPCFLLKCHVFADLNCFPLPTIQTLQRYPALWIRTLLSWLSLLPYLTSLSYLTFSYLILVKYLDV